MAIVQISRIQIRRGLQQDLPQLAIAEMGWSIDSQKLYIGNGTLSEHAPVEGRTRILTEADLTSIPASDITGIQSNITILQSNVAALAANTMTLGASTSGLIRGISANNAIINYTLNQGGTLQRRGAVNFSRISSTVIYQDDYTETSTSDIVLSMTANSTAASLNYTTTTATTFTYTLNVL